MKASDALKKLKQCIDIKFYIGPAAVKAIHEACADKPAKVKKEVKKESKD